MWDISVIVREADLDELILNPNVSFYDISLYQLNRLSQDAGKLLDVRDHLYIHPIKSNIYFQADARDPEDASASRIAEQSSLNVSTLPLRSFCLLHIHPSH
jgi:hypothetical protein